MDLFTVFIVLLVHYISDFLMQNELMANNKSKNIYWLGTHCVVYGLGLFILISLFNILSFIGITSYYYLFLFVMINVLIHFVVDYTTSKITTKLYHKKRFRAFFNVIGMDQLIHTMILLISFKYLIYIPL